MMGLNRMKYAWQCKGGSVGVVVWYPVLGLLYFTVAVCWIAWIAEYVYISE